MIEEIRDLRIEPHHGQLGEVLAYVIRGDWKPGLRFASDPSAPLQVATMRHETGREIDPHYHPKRRTPERVGKPVEVLHVRSGALRLDFYADDGFLARTVNVFEGDTVVMLGGGHGGTFLAESEVLEVRTGPYAGADDKVRFAPKRGG